MDVEVLTDNQLSIIGVEDVVKGWELGEKCWRVQRGARQAEGDDSEWFSGGGVEETEELECGEREAKGDIFYSQMVVNLR